MNQVSAVLDELAKHIASECYRQYRRSQRWTALSHTDYQQLARGTACMALAQFYGPDDLPPVLPREVKTLGCRLLDDELTGPGSEYYDWKRRNVGSSKYKTGSPRRCSQSEIYDRWTCYQQSVDGVLLDEQWEEEMKTLLAAQLRADQWTLLQDWYLHGKSTAQLAQQIIDADLKYQVPGGYDRAVTLVGVRLLRARTAARAILEQRFADRAAEVAA